MAEALKQKCQKCGKSMKLANFYRYKDGTYMSMCKQCYTLHMDCFKPDTFLWALQECDVPYIPSQWNSIRDRYFERNPNETNATAVFGRYLSVMKLTQWKDYGWQDTFMLQEYLDEGLNEVEVRRRDEELKAARNSSDITEAEYLTKVSVETRHEEKVNKPPPTMEEAVGDANHYKDQDFLSIGELPNPAASLTKQDQIYLVMKWGDSYTPSELLTLEKKYVEMKRDFGVDESDSEGTLILLCKTYLKLNQAIDSNDFETYNRLSKSYDAMRKSAKFTAAQKKEEKKDFIDCVGNLVRYCEKEGGRIPKYDLSVDHDIFDKVIRDLKKYNRDLIYEDSSLTRQIENYLKKQEALQRRREEERLAKKRGIPVDKIPNTDEERMAFFQQQKDAAEADAALQQGG